MVRKMKDCLLFSLVLVLLIGAGYLAGYRKGRANAPYPPTNVAGAVEYHRDTITLEKPVPVGIFCTDTVYLPVIDTVRLRDTLYFAAPRESRVYEDSLFRAVVSGYLPSLDRIDIFRTERVLTVRKRWGFGVGIGPGLVVSPDGRAHFGVGAAAGVRVDF